MYKVLFLKGRRIFASKNFETRKEAQKEVFELKKDVTLSSIRIIKI